MSKAQVSELMQDVAGEEHEVNDSRARERRGVIVFNCLCSWRYCTLPDVVASHTPHDNTLEINDVHRAVPLK